MGGGILAVAVELAAGSLSLPPRNDTADATTARPTNAAPRTTAAAAAARPLMCGRSHF